MVGLIRGNHLFILYALTGLALAWLVSMGCVPNLPADAPTVTPAVSSVMPDAVTPAPANPTATSAPAVPPPGTARPGEPETSNRLTGASTPEAAPAATTVPTPALTPVPPTASPKSAAATVSRNLLTEAAFGYLIDLAEGLGPRESATEQELEAAEHLLAQFTELGYSPVLQEFERQSQVASLSIGASDETEEEDIRTLPLNGSVSGETSGALELVGLARPEDIPEGGLDGKIALIERGEVTFHSKVTQVAGAGAAAAIVFNNIPGRFQGTLGGTSKIPAVAISQEDGKKIQELMAAGEVKVTVTVANMAQPSRNVIAELPGTGDGVVVVGAHFDTVPESIGANDNASGMGVLLALAEELADRPFPFTLRFITFGAEETGLHGSRHYVGQLTDAELAEIKAMVNLDVVGSGSGLRVTGDRWLTSHVKETADREDTTLSVSGGIRGGSSDHASFRDAWIPVIFFHADDKSRINTPADTMEHINSALLGDTASLVLDLLESLESLPGYAG